MREIKVRAYAKEEKQWVFGYGVDWVEWVEEVAKEKGCKKSLFLYQSDDLYEVHEESVGQYTNATDKNGKEIYDGDITIDGYGTVTVIENDGFQWLERIVRLRDRHISKEILIMTKANAFRCEVIGNIYENPELLEGE